MFRLSCGLYDQLEIFAMRKTKVEIQYMDIDGNELVEQGVITNLMAKDGVESIEFNKEKVIKTQDIIVVNGVEFTDDNNLR